MMMFSGSGKDGDQSGMAPMGGMMEGMMGGMMGGNMPLQMMMMMKQMMPQMMGQGLSGMPLEERQTYITELVGNVLSHGTADMSDEDYASFLGELFEGLKERKTPESTISEGCC